MSDLDSQRKEGKWILFGICFFIFIYTYIAWNEEWDWLWIIREMIQG